ncbi:MAG: hypothetical protein A2901_02655 [Elusimicrobia bacterium RIFCSPLOWO2_01_FULL_54_10]|nr:MAG: hypothetical protein A2901_02655 [Elusimicrobia bacterium RIFCSPLOWO2_01_FULL_54_10]
MKRNLAYIFALLLSLELTGSALAGTGRHTAHYLKADIGAKGVALAGTQFASEGDSFAQFYNPALMAGIARREVGFTHNEFIEDLRQDVVTYAHPMSRLGVLAASVNYFTYGKIAGFDATGAPTGDTSARDFVMSGSWAKSWDLMFGENIIKDFSTGATFKILNRKLDSETGNTFAVDAGAAYPLTLKYLNGLKLAGSVQNVGPGIKFKNASSPLPTTVRLGMSRSWFGNALTLNFDEVLPLNAKPFHAVSAQYKILKMFDLRIGYKSDKALDQKMTYGLGFENPIIRADYSFIPFADLGNTHRISMIYRFGKSSRLATADDQLKTKVKEAQSLYAQGLLVDAFVISFQIQRVAPWLEENNKFLAKLQNDFKSLEESNQKDKLMEQAQSLFVRAEKFFEAGNLLDARTEFQAVLVLQPENKAAKGYLNHIEGQFLSFVESFYRSGMVSFAEENYEKAKEEFEKVLTIKPDHAESKVQLEKSIEMLEVKQQREQEELQKHQAENDYKAGMGAFKNGNYEESFRLFGDVIKLSPDYEEVQKYHELSKIKLYDASLSNGRDMATKGSWETAIRHFRKALEINSTDEAKTALHDSQRRWDLQKKVLSQNLYKEGLEAFLSGDKVKANAAWTRAVELDPENEEAKRGKDRLKP